MCSLRFHLSGNRPVSDRRRGACSNNLISRQVAVHANNECENLSPRQKRLANQKLRKASQNNPAPPIKKVPSCNATKESRAPQVAVQYSTLARNASARASGPVPFLCPTCGEDLLVAEPSSTGGKLLRCASAHTVAVAKGGEVNLVPAGRTSRSAARGVRGDHDDSIRARRAFFESGGYQSQRDTVSAEVARALAPLAVPPSARGRSERRTLHVLDAGTGEGAFLGDVASTLSHDRRFAGVGLDLVGTDISKLAVKLAAKKYAMPAGAMRFAVALSNRLPFPDGSLDCVVSVLAPVPAKEFARVLRPGGALVVARPGPLHLQGVKALIYRDVAPQVAADVSELPPATRVVTNCTQHTFCGEQAAQLFKMTPFYWKAPAELQDLVCSGHKEFTTTVDFVVSTYRF